MKIYFAGPDVFRGDIEGFFRDVKKLCEQYGHEALIPDFQSLTAEERFVDNIHRIRRADIIIANINPFRGPHIDDGTAMEIGVAYTFNMLGYSKFKRIYGYTKYWDSTLKDQYNSTHPNFDPEFPVVEDFNRPVNLMISEAIYGTSGAILPTIEDILKTL